MWTDLLLAALLAIVFLLLPGLLLVRALGSRWELALCVAPAATLVGYGILSIGYGALGVPCGWPTLFLPLVALGVVLCLVRARRSRAVVPGFDARLEAPPFGRGPLSRLSSVQLAMVLGVAAALATSVSVYVLSLGDPNSFVQTYDNAWHLSRVHEFAESANYSPLAGGLYPSAWHGIAAMVESGLGVSTAVAEHAANLAFIIGAYPASSVLLLATLFPDRPRRVVLGGMLCLIFAFFPWRIMLFGPLYPNLAAFTLMPAEAALFILLCGKETEGSERPRYAALFVIGGAAMALAQPNAIFSAGVFLMPYCVWRLREFVSSRLGGKPRRLLRSVGAAALLALAFVTLWVILAKAPFMREVVEYPRKPLLDLGTAVRWGLGFSFVIRRQQFFIAAVVALGALVLLLRPGRRWLVVSYALLLGIYVVAVSTEGAIQHLVAGFWYSDYYRLAAAVCVFCVPVVAAGMDAVVGIVMWCARGLGRRFSALRECSFAGGAIASTAVVCAILALNYVPFDFVEWYYRSYGFDAVAYEMRDLYQNPANRILGDEEKEFAKRVRGLIPEGERVLNVPFDGSAYSYSACGLDVVYDSFSIDQNPDFETLRTSLNRIASDDGVRAAAERAGVRYVLQLDQGSEPNGFGPESSIYTLGYDSKLWRGLTSISDSTPGFECLLSEDDMRLYRIAV